MSAVRRATRHERRHERQSTAAPWSWRWLPTRLPLGAYVIAVISADLALAGWLLGRYRPQAHEIALFAAFMLCAVACVEASRRWGAPPPGTRDLLTAWWLPAALLLPPVFVIGAPVLIALLTHWRARQGPLYWRTFSGAAMGLAGGAASFVFHVSGPTGRWFLHPAAVGAALGSAALFVVLNTAIVAVAARAAGPRASRLRGTSDPENLLVDVAGLCAGVLVAIACGLSPALLVVALPPVMLLQRSLLHQHLSNAARTDAKTGLLNATAWQREAEESLRRVRRAGLPACVLLADIDHFKRVNDTYGHLAGDQLLVAVAATLAGHLRAGDILGRFGGEEFVVLLPDAGETEACRIADRLRAEVAATTALAGADRITVTVSIGVAALDTDGSGIFELVAAADAALYRAKSSGRDRVCTLG